ncbi:HAMP domain-containing protein [Horticoccus luteus]|uniref:histidine kinase n=1 Tax=Horticoccus luteus TaxID=2862869 RepID=A0A8F9TUQ2_9BACT|nr:ATP-binding protein [Horticoccus luteus]QYM79441.1 HAMP domain-containing protein [Horticoccus luteus]
MRIRTAIFGVYVAASAAGFCVLMALVLREVRLRYMESMRHTLTEVATVLASGAGDVRNANEAQAARDWRQGISVPVREEGRGVQIFTVSGSDAAAIAAAKGAPPVMLGDAGGGTTGRGAALVGRELRAWAPVVEKERTVGFVVVARSIDSAVGEIARARWRLAAFGLGVAGAMMALGWWIAQRLTRSLERLTTYVEALREGEGGAAPTSRAKEVQALAGAFERMRRTLEGKAYVERYTQALAHEIKAPLAGVRGAAELLREDLPAEERERFLRHLEVESERIAAIVDRLLELSAVEARNGRIEIEDVDLLAVADEVVESVRLAAEARGVGLVVSGSVVIVPGERFLLVRAIANLVQNAIDFSPADGVVRVRVAEADARGAVTVQDDGPGIPPYAKERIFERFYSLARPVTGRKSTGLGLSLVQEVATLHRGTITVEGGARGGTTARLSLPR